MKFIIKLSPEITIKSESVRLRFIKILSSSIRNILRAENKEIGVLRNWDHIIVNVKNPNQIDEIRNLLLKIPGIHHILLVEEFEFIDLNHIFEYVFEFYKDKLIHKTFCVRVKRKGKHDFTSIDAEKFIGGGLNQHIESAKVKLKSPEITVFLEINENKLFLIKSRFEALGGLPIGSQEDVLSLISGGFDSSVSSFQFIKRGSRVHYCFFNLGGMLHEIGVKQMAYLLWKSFGSSHKVRFFAIDFSEIVGDILEHCENGQMGVVLKRMMIRAASKIAKRFKINALVTGEAVGQVSSQTLSNLQLIDSVSENLILRPLIVSDKEEIIRISKQIGTDNLAKSLPEFCGIISKKPTVKAIREKIETEETNLDFDLLENAIKNVKIYDIRELSGELEKTIDFVENIEYLTQNDIVIDIRSPEEQEENPLKLNDINVIKIPFYRLISAFPELSQNQEYALYCAQGIMSKLQANYLKELGFKNVKVYQK